MPLIIVVSPSTPADGWLPSAIAALEPDDALDIRRLDAGESPAALDALEPDVVWVDAASLLDRVPPVLGARDPGRPLLLTRGATALPYLLDLDGSPTVPRDCAGLLGPCSFRGHPLFDDLGRSPVTAARATRTLFVPANRPAHARIIALARFPDGIDPDTIAIRSYDPGTAPRMLCIGGGIDPDAPDAGTAARAIRMIGNAIAYLRRATNEEPRGTLWPPPGTAVYAGPELELPESATAGQALPLDAHDPFIEATGAIRHLAGRRACAIVGQETELLAPPLRIARGLRIASVAGDHLATRVTPLGIERTLRRDEATIVERIALPRDLPAAFVEWEADTPVRIDVSWDVDLHLDGLYAGAGGDLAWNSAAGALAARSSAGDRALFSLSRADVELRVEPPEEEGRPFVRCGFSTELTPGETLRLTAWGGHAGLDPATPPATLRNAAGLVRSRAATLRRMEREQLNLATPEPAIDAAFARARAAVGDALIAFPGLGRALGPMRPSAHADEGVAAFTMRTSFRTALASLALGGFEAVRDTLAFVGSLQDVIGALPAACTAAGVARYDGDRATVLYLLLLARYGAWSGDLGFVGEEWRRVEPAIAFCEARAMRSESPADDAPAPLRAAALSELAVAAANIGVNLPVSTDPIVSLSPRAQAPPPITPADDPEPASRLIASVANDLLGMDPDAPRHRLGLRPGLPDHWRSLDVTGLRMGDAAVSLRYRRDGGRHVLRMEQTFGAAPVRLVLEPLLAADALRAATVDGTPAELDARPHEGRLLVPVQIVLDHAREVVLEV